MGRKGQIWIETVIYTLIGLTLIGIALAIVLPKINADKDQIVVEQSLTALSAFDTKIREVENWGEGNIREIPEFSVKRGELFVNSPEDEIFMVVNDLSAPYSEPGTPVQYGSVTILTEIDQDVISVKLSLSYSGVLNITYGGGEFLRKFENAPVPYTFFIENKGTIEDLVVIDVIEA